VVSRLKLLRASSLGNAQPRRRFLTGRPASRLVRQELLVGNRTVLVIGKLVCAQELKPRDYVGRSSKQEEMITDDRAHPIHRA
jgi:hypothetical protein